MHRIVVVFVALSLGACARLNSIHRVSKADALANQATVVTVDAKQRHLLIAPNIDTDVEAKFRICAEASPDVFSAYASSLGVDIGIGATDRNAKLANSIAETAATLERTQTVNLLRESMYRTCERFLSGALSKEQFVVQAARDQRSMVAVLAIEQLTGVMRPKATIISGPATSAALVDGEEAAKLIARFSDEEGAAKKSVTSAETAFASAKKTGKCDTVTEKPADDSKDPPLADWLACKEAETLLAQRKQELKAATARLDKALSLAADFVDKSNASTSGGTNSSEAGTVSRPGDAALIAVADSIERIVLAPGVDEPLMFCLAYLGGREYIVDEVLKKCLAIIEQRAAQDDVTRQMLLGSVELGRQFDRFFKRLSVNVRATPIAQLPAAVSSFEKKAGISLKLDAADCSRTATVCVQALRNSEISELYLAEAPKMEAALDNWGK